jgi:hypothetical protein
VQGDCEEKKVVTVIVRVSLSNPGMTEAALIDLVVTESGVAKDRVLTIIAKFKVRCAVNACKSCSILLLLLEHCSAVSMKGLHAHPGCRVLLCVAWCGTVANVEMALYAFRWMLIRVQRLRQPDSDLEQRAVQHLQGCLSIQRHSAHYAPLGAAEGLGSELT